MALNKFSLLIAGVLITLALDNQVLICLFINYLANLSSDQVLRRWGKEKLWSGWESFWREERRVVQWGQEECE